MPNFISDSSEVMPALQTLVNAITSAQIDRAGTRMDAPKANENALGTLHSELARRLHCVRAHMLVKSKELFLQAQTAADDDAEKQLLAESKRLDALADIARDMLWYEVRQSMDCWSGNIGIRKGWMVVSYPDQRGGDMPEFLKQILGGMGGE